MASKKKSPESLPGDSGQDNRTQELAGSERHDSTAAPNERKGSPSLLDAALAYAAKGIPVFPCRQDKAPKVRGGHNAATTDADQIRRWWKLWSGALIGAPTGDRSGIAVLDIDCKPEKNKDGFKALPDWETRSPVIARTRSGGAHLYFRAAGAPHSTVDVLAHGLDTRGNGAYVIVPPSPGYTWMTDHDLSSLPPWPRDMLLPERSVTYGTELQAEDYGDVAAALAVIPNDDVSWDEWNNVAMATFAATDGEGFEDFVLWSQKSSKHEIDETYKKWRRLERSPPKNIGAGTIFWMANQAQPNWRSDHAAKLASMLSSVDANDFIDEMLGRSQSNAARQRVDRTEPALSGNTSLDEQGGAAADAIESSPSIECSEAGDEPAPPIEQSDLSSSPTPEPPAQSDAVEPSPPVDNPEPSPASPSSSSPDPAPPVVAKDVPSSQAAPKPRLNSRNPLLKTNAEFLSGFKPPDYLIYGLVQRGFIYSMTAPTGTGKTAVLLLLAAMVAQGKKLGDRDVEQGKVLFLAGENPDDVRMRWIKQAELMKFDHDKIDVVWRDGRFNLAKWRPDLAQEAKILGPFALIIVDTAAAFFAGQEENSNVQLGDFARELRSLTQLDGTPTVIVSTHPTKNPDMDNLLPRGGGAFLAEIDGNFACRRISGNGNNVELVTHGKFRGPEFSPISFSINAGTSDRLKDSKGRSIWTVTAQLLTAAERAKVDQSGEQREDDLLAAMADNPGASLATLAGKAGWPHGNDGQPNKKMAYKVMKVLLGKKLVKKNAGDRYELTKSGKEEAARVKTERDRM
jgi:hypothetical protein